MSAPPHHSAAEAIEHERAPVAESLSPIPPGPAWPDSSPRSFRARLARSLGALGWRLNLALLLATFATTTIFGAFFFFLPPNDSFLGLLRDLIHRLATDPLPFLAHGLPYSIPVLLILGSHEMGHYSMCRRYRVRATLPYFIPSIIPFPFGTFGAVIRMRPPVPSKRALFDIGISGPIAGFVVALPVLIYGLATADVARSAEAAGEAFGNPLAITLLERVVHGPFPTGTDLVMNPPLLAGWLGLLVTAMNLFPVGQLDGGHVTYALSPRLHGRLSRVTIAAMVGLVTMTLLRGFASHWGVAQPAATALWILGGACAALLNIAWRGLPRAISRLILLLVFSGFTAGLFMAVVTPWFVWTIVLVLIGRAKHPPIGASEEALGPLRSTLALSALLIFVLSFMPVPVEILK